MDAPRAVDGNGVGAIIGIEDYCSAAMVSIAAVLTCIWETAQTFIAWVFGSVAIEPRRIIEEKPSLAFLYTWHPDRHLVEVYDVQGWPLPAKLLRFKDDFDQPYFFLLSLDHQFLGTLYVYDDCEERTARKLVSYDIANCVTDPDLHNSILQLFMQLATEFGAGDGLMITRFIPG